MHSNRRSFVNRKRSRVVVCAAAATAALGGLLPAGIAHADITGFSNFTVNSTDTAGSGIGNNGTIFILTSTDGNTATSGFDANKQNINNFVVNFDYKDVNGGGADGFTFVVHNDTRGINALGSSGGTLGYGGTNQIANSVADTFNIYGPNGAPSSNINFNGRTGAYRSTSPVDFTQGFTAHVQLSYLAANGRLVETITDTATNDTFTRTYTNVNLQQTVGAATAYVGFTGGTGGAATPQQVRNFTFVNGGATALAGLRPDMTPIAFTGYNHDMVIDAAAIGKPVTSVDATMDNGTNKTNNLVTGNTWYEAGYVPTTPASGLPMGKTVQSQFTQALANSSIQFGPANGNNALLLNAANKTGTFTLSSAGRYSQLAIYESSGHGGSGTMTATLNFTDGRSPVTLAPINLQDWFGGTASNLNTAFISSGRGDMNGGVNNVGVGNPRIYEDDFDLASYIGDPLASVTFNWAGGASTQTDIFGMSGSLIPPSNLVWNQPGGTWDSTVTNTPWLNTATSTPSAFFAGDNANFTDAAVGTVNIAPAGVAPNATTVSNTTGTYTFTGGAILSGPLTKSNAGTLTLANGANTFTNVTVTGGTVNVGTASSTAPLTVSGTMNVSDGAAVNLTANAAARVTHSIANLNLNASGTLDLGNHAVLTTTTDNIRAYVARAAGPVLPTNGLNAWTGPGLTSSLVKADAANSNARQLAVGYFDSRDNAQTGLSVPTGKTLVQYTVYGDATGDSKVDIADLSVWNNNFGAGNRWSQGDWNYDGKIDISDLSIWNNDFGNQLSGGTIKPGVRAAGAVAAASSAVAGHATPTLTSSASASASPAATPLPATLELDVNTATGDATLNSGGVTLAAIELDSASGILLKSGWQSLRLGHGFNQWSFPRGTPSATSLSEYTSDASSASGQPATLAAGTLTDYGLIFPVGFSDPTDLTFKYNIADPTTGLTAPRTGTVVFTSGGVPEPTCLALGGVAAIGLLARKRRKL